MKKLTISFDGYRAEDVAQKFFTWIVDGGLEDSIIDVLSDQEISVTGLTDFDENAHSITIGSSKPD